ncbi:hypothetical protein [Micromonospora humi]|uniref:SipW-cognate class signal peptide n=1 Tax=Micromonospora humi TaxID=745366 RepID=A0A1C5JIN6_9ACTN|nr:hypothetical protein [Micromonospora humi]SCG70464.1 hypothetical protein GA0070213_111144 [Micromonospora humi]
MKRTLTAAAVVGAAALTGGLLTAAPAYAADCLATVACPTGVTFTITAGALNITVPDTATLTTQPPSGSPTSWWAFGTLGTGVTVTDLRASNPANWVVTVASTDFTHSGTGPLISSADVYYCSGPATSSGGVGNFNPGQLGPCTAPPPPVGVSLSSSQTAFTHTAGIGVNTASWTPSLSVQIPLNAVAGSYTGTITHTVT